MPIVSLHRMHCLVAPAHVHTRAHTRTSAFPGHDRPACKLCIDMRSCGCDEAIATNGDDVLVGTHKKSGSASGNSSLVERPGKLRRALGNPPRKAMRFPYLPPGVPSLNNVTSRACTAPYGSRALDPL